MEKNKTGKYLKYAIGEIVLVVIGILIALQLNQSSENRKTNNTRQEYYQQLLEDLNRDKQYINETIKHFEEDRTAYNAYLETYKNSKLTALEVYENL